MAKAKKAVPVKKVVVPKVAPKVLTEARQSDAQKLDPKAPQQPVLRTTAEGVILSDVLVSPEGVVLKVRS